MKKYYFLIVTSLIVFFVFSGFPKASALVVIGKSSNIEQTHPYAPAIIYLKDNNIISGYADGTFGIHNSITRAEFITVLMKAAGFEGVKNVNCFKDVKKEWFAPYVCQAKELNFIESYSGPDLFKPNDFMKFKDAVIAIVNVFDLKLKSIKGKDQLEPYMPALEKINALPVASPIYFEGDLSRGIALEMIWRVATKTTDKKSTTYAVIKKANKMMDSLDGLNDPKAFKEGKVDGEDIGIIFDPLIEDENIFLNPGELPFGVDEQTAKQIKLIAFMQNASYKSIFKKNDKNGPVFLHVFKNIAYIAVPSKKLYAIFPPPVDAETAVLLGNTYEGNLSEVKDSLFLKDKKMLYRILPNYKLEPLDSVDAATFKSVKFGKQKNPRFFRDKSHIYHYYGGNLYEISNAKVDTFAEKKWPFFLDNENIFFFNKKNVFMRVLDVDVKTFEEVYVSNSLFAKDKKNVWAYSPDFGGIMKKIEGANPKTFDFKNYAQNYKSTRFKM